MYVDNGGSDWDGYLPMVLHAYRVSYHHGIRTSPFKMLTGQDPRTVVERLLEARTEGDQQTNGSSYSEPIQSTADPSDSGVGTQTKEMSSETNSYLQKIQDPTDKYQETLNANGMNGRSETESYQLNLRWES